jgi:hypothetical protein
MAGGTAPNYNEAMKLKHGEEAAGAGGAAAAPSLDKEDTAILTWINSKVNISIDDYIQLKKENEELEGVIEAIKSTIITESGSVDEALAALGFSEDSILSHVPKKGGYRRNQKSKSRKQTRRSRNNRRSTRRNRNNRRSSRRNRN